MASGWNIYYVVFLSALLGLGLPALLGLISLAVSGKRSRPESAASPLAISASPPAQEMQSVLGRKINTRFFLSANAALILLTLILILIPCVSTLRAGLSQSTIVFGLMSVLTITVFAMIGLFYAARKGDLYWLRSYREGASREK